MSHPHVTTATPARIRVEVTTPPDPGRLRAALVARFAGCPWPAGVEADIAEQVRAAVADREEGGTPWP